MHNIRISHIPDTPQPYGLAARPWHGVYLFPIYGIRNGEYVALTPPSEPINVKEGEDYGNH